MRRLSIIVGLMILPSLAWSQAVDERFVGTWLLDRIETRSQAGDWTRADTRLGTHPVGVISYDRTGNMAVQIMRADRAPLSSRPAQGEEDTLALAPAAEKANAFDGYTAYFGTYSVRADESIVVHHRLGHLVPNRAGSPVERTFEFTERGLILSVPGGNRLVWKRAE